MSRAQRRLVREWIVIIVFLVVVMAAAHYLTPRQLGWARWLILPLILIARMAVPYGEADRRGRPDFNEIAQEHRWIKWWAALCAIFFLGAAIFVTHSSYRVADQDTLTVLFLSFAALLGPMVILIERERFRELKE